MSLDFKPGQIVSLEHSDRNLFLEVIQVVVSRQLCWVRPLLLVSLTQESPLVTDMRDASDLLWPVNLFRPALDTEVITFLSQVLVKEPNNHPDSAAKVEFNQFIHEIWHAHQEGEEAGE
ncbi:hypothetical protein VB620_13150 [Nodularia harveyana UHCC-0300]|uniref:Uncharacterized protein n=1 Tax=Nodularia harveyana UHCC-0300 TaxID=2974287 RepID=A0ABU5UFF5_9CYAN|nr:hypothetical protein [Nodularia harveyana]MEA5582284.1 hypothetical protein [Nodularia harveyana UHCC-0300]